MPGMSSGRNRNDSASGCSASRLDGPSGSADEDGRVITYLYDDVPAFDEKRGATKIPSHLSYASRQRGSHRLGSAVSKWASSAQPPSASPSRARFSAHPTVPAWPDKHDTDVPTLSAFHPSEHTFSAEDDAWASWGKGEATKNAGETGADAYARRVAMGRGTSSLQTSSAAVMSGARPPSSTKTSPSKSPGKPASRVQRPNPRWTASPNVEVEMPSSKNNILLDLVGLHLAPSSKIASEDTDMLSTHIMAPETSSDDEVPSLTWAPLSPSTSTAQSSQPMSPSTSQESGSTTTTEPVMASQKAMLERAVRASTLIAGDEEAAAVLNMLLDLPKRERLLCQFNERHLQTKIGQAFEIVRIQESEEEEL